MNKELLLYVSDGIRPIKTEKYFLTSEGRTSKDFNPTTYSSFLTVSQVIGKEAFYKSIYDVYKLSSKYYLSLYNFSDVYKEENVSDFSGLFNNEGSIDYIVDNDELYVLNFDGKIERLLVFLIKKYNLKIIYSKNKIIDKCEVIKFYFEDRRGIKFNDTIINEAFKNGLLGDYKDSLHYSFGEFESAPSRTDSFPLLMLPRDSKSHINYLRETDYYEFVDNINKIKEFEYNESIEELGLVSAFNGKFYFLEEDSKLIGFVCIGKSSQTYLYISYLSIIKKYRKKGYSNKLIESLKYIANEQKKNLILTIEVRKLLNFYKSFGFKTIQPFDFD